MKAAWPRWNSQMASDHSRRLKLLEAAHNQALRIDRHCIMWWPGQPWAEVIARYGADRVKRGHRVMLLTFAAAGEEPDPIQARDAAMAKDWLGARGVAHA